MAATFLRPHHNAILHVLRSLDGDFLDRVECFFAGGTAIVLELHEYPESLDIDFLCASQDGYRALRGAVWERGLAGLLREAATLREHREMRSDQYGIRGVIDVEGARIRLEIVREARIDLTGAMRPAYGLPVLDRRDMYAEKLLANADRGSDASTLSRDIIVLSMMIAAWGPVPEAAWASARGAYGETVDLAYARSVRMIRDPVWLRRCMDRMAMDPDLAGRILAVHGGPERPDTD